MHKRTDKLLDLVAATQRAQRNKDQKFAKQVQEEHQRLSFFEKATDKKYLRLKVK